MTLPIFIMLALALNPYCAVSGFDLQATSLAIDAGVLIPEIHCAEPLPTENTDCVPWAGIAPDIGACEFISSIEPPPPPPPPPGNTAPMVYAGPDMTAIVSIWIQLSGIVSDDGLPFGTLIWDWSVISKPPNGQVWFQYSQALDTLVAFSRRGTYTLRLTASDGELTSSDDVTVR